MDQEVRLQELERSPGIEGNCRWGSVIHSVVGGDEERGPKALSSAHREIAQRIDERHDVRPEWLGVAEFFLKER